MVVNVETIHLNNIPVEGEKVTLNNLANMSKGAICTDVTDEIHSTYFEWIEQLSAHYKVGYFAVDFIAEDFNADPTNGGSYLLEINARPEWVHHTFSEKRQHNVATMVLDALTS